MVEPRLEYSLGAMQLGKLVPDLAFGFGELRHANVFRFKGWED